MIGVVIVGRNGSRDGRERGCTKKRTDPGHSDLFFF
jgi:hypothetical protein